MNLHYVMDKLEELSQGLDLAGSTGDWVVARQVNEDLYDFLLAVRKECDAEDEYQDYLMRCSQGSQEQPDIADLTEEYGDIL